MYAQTEHAANKNIEGIYRSDDAGDHWTQLSANGVNADANQHGLRRQRLKQGRRADVV